MRKTLFLFTALLIAVIFNVQPAQAGPSVNQRFTLGTEGLTLDTDPVVAQSFTPSVSGLSYVMLQLGNVGVGDKVSVAIRKKSITGWGGRLAYVADQVPVDGWNTFDFSDITVTVNEVYGIFVSASGTNPSTKWIFSSSNGTYLNGNMVVNSSSDPSNPNYIDMNSSDLNFKTYGTSPVEMVEEQTNPGSDQTPEQTGAIDTPTTPTTSGQAPATTIETSIKVPTQLEAQNLTGASPLAVKLTWTKSASTDITGYIIFRSTVATTDFSEIGRVSSSIAEYIDSTVTANTKYYFFVRAYKDDKQSVSTSTVDITTEDSTTAADTTSVSNTDITPATLTETSAKNDSNRLLITLVAIFVALTGTLAYLKIRAKKQNNIVSDKLFLPLVGLISLVGVLIVVVTFFVE